MSDALTLPAEARERTGKGATRQLRREGRVPAVIYGGKQEPITIHMEEKEVMRLLGTGHFMNSLVMIETGGETIRTLPKDVAFHPVTDRPVHIDFLRLTRGAKVEVQVPVVFTNEALAPGLKKGGVLNIVRHELDLICDPDKIPSEIQIDVTGVEVGDSIHISRVNLPAGSESAITDRDFTIATVVAPSALKRSEAEQTGADMEAGETAATELGPDADAAEEQEEKSE
ncbi:50S ribosomal protein L25/general stress protein Ctc [Altericroceibacterium xinjiangense]|uniref:50S ribosomal protein L25/general stress protein Ctc n=1 Tax=Altericroceibacterium xinjiangense TaxID=762261 RepID=UPI000F7E679B|nr:50S ribosomal protein L25/general stress protein Ctc [Altericroceibacterium xinjiangense]